MENSPLSKSPNWHVSTRKCTKLDSTKSKRYFDALKENILGITIYSQHPVTRMPVNSNIRYLKRILISPRFTIRLI